ncbi:MAG: hypothetical protein ACLR43_06450 [Faecalibacillus faecis]
MFYGENQWLQFMYIKHVIQNIFLIKQVLFYMFYDQEHKNQLGYFGRVSGRDKKKWKSVE